MKIDKKKVLKDLSVLLKSRFADDLTDVLLFGSQIKGQAHKDSDYDILIILKQKADWKIEREISDLCFEVDLKYNIITDTHVIGESELNTLRGKQPIFVNAIANGLHTWLTKKIDREFMATKKLDPQFGKILRNAFQNRTKGDYDAFVEFTKNEVDLMLVEMTDFINEIKKIL